MLTVEEAFTRSLAAPRDRQSHGTKVSSAIQLDPAPGHGRPCYVMPAEANKQGNGRWAGKGRGRKGYQWEKRKENQFLAAIDGDRPTSRTHQLVVSHKRF
jgi:hypothetical protein|uniref:Uncharacterized protein n=1 Tax=Bionectria ochroleuca TaxID=29856 RepID=A0A8H7NJB1_BIOOC